MMTHAITIDSQLVWHVGPTLQQTLQLSVLNAHGTRRGGHIVERPLRDIRYDLMNELLVDHDLR